MEIIMCSRTSAFIYLFEFAITLTRTDILGILELNSNLLTKKKEFNILFLTLQFGVN